MCVDRGTWLLKVYSIRIGTATFGLTSKSVDPFCTIMSVFFLRAVPFKSVVGGGGGGGGTEGN